MLIELGQEFGSTTGRRRIANWLNLNKLVYAIKISGVTKLIINKCDILEKLHLYKLFQNNNLYKFNNLNEMKFFIQNQLSHLLNDKIDIIFSGNKEVV